MNVQLWFDSQFRFMINILNVYTEHSKTSFPFFSAFKFISHELDNMCVVTLDKYQ